MSIAVRRMQRAARANTPGGILTQQQGNWQGNSFTVSVTGNAAATSLVVIVIAADTDITPPGSGGLVQRSAVVNKMGHYVYTVPGGGASSWNFTSNGGGGLWWATVVGKASFDSITFGQNPTEATSYSTAPLTPSAGNRLLIASIAGITYNTDVRSMSGWTNGFTEVSDTCLAAIDYPVHGVATRTVAANGTTSYATAATYSAASFGLSSVIIAINTTAAGGGGGTVPPAPQTINPGSITASSLTVSWTAVGGADGYRLYRNGSQVGGDRPLAPQAYTFSGLSASTSYTLGVSAYNSYGESAQTSTTVTTSSGGGGGGVAPLSHGFYVTTANTGPTAYYDSSLGRNLTLADLTVHTADTLLSDLTSPGGTVYAHDFRGGLTIDIDNVTIKACRIDGTLLGDHGGSYHHFNAEWCLVETVNSPPGDQAIGYGEYTAYRCTLIGSSDGGKIDGNASLTECYIRVRAQSTADHGDGLQNASGTGDVLVERCNIDCRSQYPGTANAALFAADGFTGLMTWNDNYCLGGGYVMRLYENGTYDCQGNWVADGSFEYGPVDWAVIPRSSIDWGTVRPNLVVDGSGNQISVINL